MTHVEVLILALLFDALVGDPKWLWQRLPHPVVFMGHGINALDRRLNYGGARHLKGVIAVVILSGISIGLGWGLGGFHWSVTLVVSAVLLSQNSLAGHVKAVATALAIGVPEGRQAVAMIVGRDPENLNTSGIARGAIESAAENFSDGVIAPAFWFLLGGLPGILLYKMINTADSMIGYRTEKYQDFGWAAARLDDLMNWVPARIAGGLIAVTSGSLRAVTVMRADAHKHRSPNAGWPEAAMAAVLGVALAGPRIYDGKQTDDGFVNGTAHKDIGPEEINAAVAVLWRSWAGLVIMVLVLAIFIRLN